MDSSRKSNKIRDIVRLQQILKKWKKAANTNKNNTTTATTTTTSTTTTSTNKSIKFLKKTLSFSESSSSSSSLTNAVPKGYVAVCVGQELKRFVIPTVYLRHQMFGILLREAEEEFGFQQEGVLRFPCEVEVFEKILKMMEDNKKRSSSSPSLMLLHDQCSNINNDDDDDGLILQQGDNNYDHVIINCSSKKNYSPDTDQLHPHPQMCR